MSNLSEYLGGGKSLKSQEFLTSVTWPKPEGVDLIYVTQIGGGGAGAAGTGSTSSTQRRGGGGGGGGESCFRVPHRITGDQVIVVGEGGVGGTSTPATHGSHSSVGTLRVSGGYSATGISGSNVYVAGIGGYVHKGGPYRSSDPGATGASAVGWNGYSIASFGFLSAGGLGLTTGAGGGAGANTFLSKGGDGASGQNGTGSSPPNNTGAGGGGGSGGATAVSDGIGGNGGSGWILIEWYE